MDVVWAATVMAIDAGMVVAVVAVVGLVGRILARPEQAGAPSPAGPDRETNAR